jgi:hypothetical protein
MPQGREMWNPATGGLNDYGRTVNEFRNSLVREMGRVNPAYREGNRLYGGPMQFREAVDTGRQMVRGNASFEDTIPAYRAATPNLQQGQRMGVADILTRDLYKHGTIPPYMRANNPKGSNELAELSQYQGPPRPDQPDQLRRFIDREARMERTNTAALGGPATAENLADMAGAPGGMQDIMGLASSAAHGNAFTFIRNAYDMASRIGRGENEAQRAAIARALTIRDPVTAQALAGNITAIQQRMRGYPGYRHPYSADARQQFRRP